MYARYLKRPAGIDTTHYEFQEQVSLFGCNNGLIPWLLGLKLSPGQGEPCKWHVNVISELGGHSKYRRSTLLIDLKPKQNKKNLSLYEVMDVWGYSNCSWSPILLRLDGLFVDAEPSAVDRNSFLRRGDEVDGPIYEFLYLDGSVANGKTTGPWAPPPASPGHDYPRSIA
jgi:hypothetical protein